MAADDDGTKAELRRRIEDAVEDALGMYRESAVLNPTQVGETRKEFLRFYLTALGQGLKGIRWNFESCLLCKRPKSVDILHRILVLHPDVVAAAGGRALGAQLCSRHLKAPPEDVVTGALNRIRDSPPKPAP